MDNKRIDKNLPNKLTISRIVLIPVIMAVLWLPLFTSADMTKCEFISAGLFLVCAITDFIDGRLARKYNIVTDFGKFMDPLADKFLVIGALLAATLVYENFRFCLILALSIIIFRELAVSSMRLVAKNADNVVIPAALPGKIKTFSKCVFVMLLLLEPYIFAFSDFIVKYRIFTFAFYVIMLFFTVYSGILYFLTYKKYIF